MSVLRSTKKWTARAVLGIFLAASVDGMSSEGEHGGRILDNLGFNQAANNYRMVGKFGRGTWLFVSSSFKSYGEEINRLGNQYGQPKP
jgi:hypothetical protein